MQVDVTASKGVLRLLGSLAGATVAMAFMARPPSADNPYLLAAELCVWSFCCGLFMQSRFKYAAFLALYTNAIVILSQVCFALNEQSCVTAS